MNKVDSNNNDVHGGRSIMGKSKGNNKVIVRCVGKSAEEVTGSAYLVDTGQEKILIDCGIYQSNNLLEDYRINNRKFDFILEFDKLITVIVL